MGRKMWEREWIDLKKLNQKTHKSKRKKAGYSVFFPRKVFRCISAAVLGIVLMAFPAMAQETVLISPNALAQLQNVSPADGGVQSLTMRADDFFTGASGITSAAQFIEELKKYQPSDWTSAGTWRGYLRGRWFSDPVVSHPWRPSARYYLCRLRWRRNRRQFIQSLQKISPRPVCGLKETVPTAGQDPLLSACILEQIQLPCLGLIQTILTITRTPLISGMI